MLSTCCVKGEWMSPKWTSSGEMRATTTRKVTSASPRTASLLRRNRTQASDQSPTCSTGTSQSIGAASTAATGTAI